MVEILRSASQDLRRRQQAAIEDADEPIARIELGIRATIAWFAEHRDWLQLLQSAATEERFRATLRRNQEVAIDDAVRHIKDAIVEGSIRDQDPEALAQGVLGVMERFARVYVAERDEPTERVADLAVSFCLRGLGR